jgi:NADPH:quinone reductase-like Zn-dependent oxidoreductase
LKAGGICSSAGYTTLPRLFAHILLGALVSKTGSKQIGLMGTAKPNKDDLEVIRGLLEAGKIRTVIDRCYPLAETAEAIRYLETGRARGKVIIMMDQN